MKFSKSVVKFNIKNISVIGNFENGGLIGLTEDGRRLCEKIDTEAISEEQAMNENKELFLAMKEMNFFETNEEKHRLFSTYLHVTQRCNLNCLGCYSYDCNRNKLQDPDICYIQHAIDELAAEGLQVLIISGGEPFLRNDLKDIVKYAKDRGIPAIQIITNGTVLKEEVLVEIKPYVMSIAVSFDGYNKENPTFIRNEGIFDKLINSVELLKKLGINTTILPTIHSKNCCNLLDYVELSRKLEVGISFSLLTCSPYDEVFKDYIPTSKQLDLLGKELTVLGQEGVSVNDMPINSSIDVRRSCEVGTKIISIGADGSVYPCHMLHDEKLIMGNAFKQPLSEIMQSKIAKELQQLHVDQFEICSECEHRYLCGGGCRARSYYKNQNFISHDYYCAMTKAFFEDVSTMLNQQYPS
ncbi:MAG: radical SAM protein [Lachnospiraceae bacterium]|nr:radical SAM protein [Lachnospiraceae bacterium]